MPQGYHPPNRGLLTAENGNNTTKLVRCCVPVFSLYNHGMWSDRGRPVLGKCESEIRSLLTDAVADGDYESVRQLAEAARIFAVLASGVAASSNVDVAAAQHVVANSGEAVPNQASRPESRRNVAQSRQKRKRAKHKYPRFSRRRGELVKTGWSKKEKKEYQHKAPRPVVNALVERLLETGGKGALFSTDELFPLSGADGVDEIPSYQAYLCLAWFRSENLVCPEGRQGYRLADPSSLAQAAGECWERLPTET